MRILGGREPLRAAIQLYIAAYRQSTLIEVLKTGVRNTPRWHWENRSGGSISTRNLRKQSEELWGGLGKKKIRKRWTSRSRTRIARGHHVHRHRNLNNNHILTGNIEKRGQTDGRARGGPGGTVGKKKKKQTPQKTKKKKPEKNNPKQKNNTTKKKHTTTQPTHHKHQTNPEKNNHTKKKKKKHKKQKQKKHHKTKGGQGPL